MPTKLFAGAAYFIGVAGAGVFFVYVVGAGTGYWPQREAKGQQQAILINAALLLLFALQHSGMARQTFKQRMPAPLERSIYVATSGIILGTLTFFWQPLPGDPIWHGPIWIVAFSILAALGIGGCCAWLGQANFFGWTQAWTGPSATHEPLRVDGPYRYVRHPLMLGFLVAIWAQPILPTTLLMLNAGMTIYVVVAIRLEEQDLVAEFGEEYEKYRNAVPMLIPWPW